MVRVLMNKVGSGLKPIRSKHSDIRQSLIRQDFHDLILRSNTSPYGWFGSTETGLQDRMTGFDVVLPRIDFLELPPTPIIEG